MNISIPINSKDHLLSLIDATAFNLHDFDKAIHQIRSFEDGFNQWFLLRHIKDCSQSDCNVVIYNLEDDATACIRVINALDKKSTEVYLHGTGLIQEMEYLFCVTFSPKVQHLQPIKNRSFEARWRQLVKKLKVSNIYPNFISIADENYGLAAETIEVYKTGIAHIKHLIDLTQQYIWWDESVHVQNGGIYRHFLFEKNNLLQFYLYRMSNGQLEIEYMFFLVFNQQKVNNQSILHLENTKLLHKLMPLCRNHRLKSIMEAV